MQQKGAKAVWRAVSALVLWMSALPLWGEQRALALSAAQLREHYAGINRIDATIEQTKRSQYLFKPLVSKISLRYRQGEIEWALEEPVQETVVINRSGMFTRSADTKNTLKPVPITQTPQGMKLVAFFHALFAFDFPKIEQSFKLSFTGSTMIAEPKAGSGLDFMKAMTFTFDDKLNLSQVKVEAKNETTDMRFLRFETAKDCGPVPPGGRFDANCQLKTVPPPAEKT